ncbi:MAG: ABC transporter transmembrane domain-containing protein [Mangrovibacterium sp.]
MYSLPARVFTLCIRYSLYELVSNYMIRDMWMDLFRHLICLPMSFFDKNKAGDILHRINNEINTIQSIVTGSVLRFINSVLTIIGISFKDRYLISFFTGFAWRDATPSLCLYLFSISRDIIRVQHFQTFYILEVFYITCY